MDSATSTSYTISSTIIGPIASINNIDDDDDVYQ